MIGQEKLHHPALGLFNFLTLRCNYHAVSADDRAGGLQLGHLLNAHQTHATRCLQREIGVVAERGDIEALFAADVDQTRAFRHLKVFAVDGDFD